MFNNDWYTFINVIEILPFEQFLWWLGMAIVILKGRPEWALAFNFCTIYWTRNFFLIPGVAQTWLLMGTLALSTLVYMIRDRKIVLTPQLLRNTDYGWLPKPDRWIIPWMVCWWIWFVVLMSNFDVPDSDYLQDMTIYYTIMTMPSVLLISWDIKRIKQFALAFVICALIGCYYALRVIEVPIDYLIQNPGLSDTRILRLNIADYFVFARFCVIGLIFCLAFVISLTNLPLGLLSLAGAGILAHFVLLAGARQAMSGAVICATLFIIWALRRGGALTTRALAVGVAVVFLGISIFQIAPHLVIRENEDGVGESFNIVGDRGTYWQQGFEIFLNSPVYGSGFETHVISHNLFVGALSDQGIVGAIFLLGYLVFALRRVWFAWFASGPIELAVMRMALANVFVFTIVHSMASGHSAKMPHLYWPIAMLWALESSYGGARERKRAEIPVPTAFVRPAVAAAPRASEQ